MKKNGITVDCKRCEYLSSGQGGEFVVTVPISDSESGASGAARLRCSVSHQAHAVELLDWNGLNPSMTRSPDNLRQRVASTLGFIEQNRFCGNRNICPREVSRIVERSSTSPATCAEEQ